MDFEVDDLRGMNQSIIDDLREASVFQSLFNVCLVLIHYIFAVNSERIG